MRCCTRLWQFDTCQAQQRIWLEPEFWGSSWNSSRRVLTESGGRWKIQKVVRRAGCFCSTPSP
ncbi:unnamed protein product [Symbiodinium natans]|uniref:Uncharacterized protein n=1 Tax=Symbiodinium natans TaxID=878477 RepID=A0A812UM32_9DINO|nr:unnamed protein product [Symbiodinium natans]